MNKRVRKVCEKWQRSSQKIPVNTENIGELGFLPKIAKLRILAILRLQTAELQESFNRDGKYLTEFFRNFLTNIPLIVFHIRNLLSGKFPKLTP